MVLNLFDDDDNNNNNNIGKIEINEEFARRYEHNKKREDLQRYDELKKSGHISDSDSDSESSESEPEPELTKTDLKLFDALIKVRNRDPLITQKDVKLFSSDDEDSETETDAIAKKEKPKKAVYMKDVTARQLIEDGPDAEYDDGIAKKLGKSYHEEQEELRRAFLDAAAETETGDEDFFRVKGDDGDGDEEEQGGGELKEKLDEYFGGDGEGDGLDENSRFLKEFFLNKMWIKGEGTRFDEDEVDELVRDEEEIEKQEEYETKYRYEENAGDKVLGHSRIVEDSVRNKRNARKEQRKNKEERMRIAEMERKEELKRLKNLKKQEIKEKLRRIREIAGIGEDESLSLDADYLEEEFEPEKHDRVMHVTYDERYYKTEDNDPTLIRNDDVEDEGDFEKPDFEKEDELLGLPKNWDVCKSDDGFSALRERILKGGEDEERDDDSGGEETEEEKEATEQGNVEGASGEDKRKRKQKLLHLQNAKNEIMEEYYKLDYEGTIGDLKTRLRYVKVNPKRYGLKTDEILMLDDRELNQYVPLKKIAPYTEQEYKVPNSKRYQQKMKIRELLQGNKSDDQKRSKRKRSKDDVTVDMANSKVEAEETNGDVEKLSRKAKRKRRQAETKISNQRLENYGKINPEPKRKRNTEAK